MARVRILKAFGLLRVGQVADMLPGPATELVKHGMAEYVDDPAETMAEEPERNAALPMPRKRRRRKKT